MRASPRTWCAHHFLHRINMMRLLIKLMPTSHPGRASESCVHIRMKAVSESCAHEDHVLRIKVKAPSNIPTHQGDVCSIRLMREYHSEGRLIGMMRALQNDATSI